MTAKHHERAARFSTNEQGLVSIIIVVILMLVISLITLSYARIARTEQRQALDRTLNTQAYYAAESGINYATKTITDRVTTGTSISSLLKDKCGPDGTANGNPTGTVYQDSLQLEPGVSTSCLLVQTNPKTLVYDLDTTQQSKVFPVRPDTQINEVIVEWSQSNTGNVGGCPNNSSTAASLPTAAAWDPCSYAILRVDLTNTSLSTGLTRQALAQNTFSAIFMPAQPSASGGTVAFTGDNSFGGTSAMQGKRVPARCDGQKCVMSITFPSATTNQFYMRIMPLYKNTQATITAKNGGVQATLRDAQIVVDATGKAQDILRRVQVRIPLINEGLHADYGLQSKQSICKAFTVFPGNPATTSSCP